MIHLTIDQLSQLKYALSSVYDHATDNSCSDLDCCGYPRIDEDDLNDALYILAKYDIYVQGYD